MATVASLISDLESNLDYEEGSGSTTKAEQVVTLCKKLLLKRPTSAGHAGSSVSYDANQIRSILENARLFLKVKASNSGGGVRFLGVTPRR